MIPKRFVDLAAYFLAVMIAFAFHPCAYSDDTDFQPPIDLNEAAAALEFCRGDAAGSNLSGSWPRTIHYTHKTYDFMAHEYQETERVFEIKKKPLRIMPHAVGVAEVLWAICPRERIAGFHEFAADPDFSFISDKIQNDYPIFTTRETEKIIGLRPDLVFTVYYSGADFKKKLQEAGIPYFDLGYFGDFESIQDQIRLIGEIIGEEANADVLVKRMEDYRSKIIRRIPKIDSPPRIMYYSQGGYISGMKTSFNSICNMVGTINVGAEQGIESLSQIDYEMLLKWNPDVVIVRKGSGLKRELTSQKILSFADAFKNGRVYEVPQVNLISNSQFIILSADLLAGLVYGGSFE